jgi:hypothetical protein
MLVDPDGVRIPITRAVYNPSSMTVTLHPKQRVSIHETYTLTIEGALRNGLTDAQGQLLGRTIAIPIDWHALVLGHVTLQFAERYHTGLWMFRKKPPAAHQPSILKAANPRANHRHMHSVSHGSSKID